MREYFGILKVIHVYTVSVLLLLLLTIKFNIIYLSNIDITLLYKIDQ